MMAIRILKQACRLFNKRDDGHLWNRGILQVIQDEATLLYPKESYRTNDVILKAEEKRGTIGFCSVYINIIRRLMNYIWVEH